MTENGSNEDAWLEQLREALASTATQDPTADSDEPPLEALEHELDEVFGGDDEAAEALDEAMAGGALDAPPSEPRPVTDPEPTMAPAPPTEPVPEPVVDPVPSPTLSSAPPSPAPAPATPDELPKILAALTAIGDSVQRLEERVEAFEVTATPVALDGGTIEGGVDAAALEAVVAEAVRKGTMKAQATGAGTVRLETEVRLLEETVRKLSKQVSEVNIAALARDRLEKDVHVERLAEAAENVERQVAAAADARTAFDAGVDKMLRHAKEDGGDVAWTDVMFLAHELRSRVDDLDDQQRRALRDLADWQASIDDRLAGFRAQILDEIRALRDPD